MKIVYLEADPLLDYWVAMAAICAPSTTATVPSCNRCISRYKDAMGEPISIPPRAFQPSTISSDAGPIIGREHINLVSGFGRWMARHGKRDDYGRADASPSVAAMGLPHVGARR